MDIKTYLQKRPNKNEIIITLPIIDKWDSLIFVYNNGTICMNNLADSVEWVNGVPNPVDICTYLENYNRKKDNVKMLLDEKTLEAIIGRWVLLNDTINIELLHAAVDYEYIVE